MRPSTVLFASFLVMLVAGCKAEESGQAADPTSSSQSSSTARSAGEANVAEMWVFGMACPQCAHNVDLQLLKVPGVVSVKIDMGSGKVQAELSPTDPPTREQLAQAIQQTGFTLKKIEMP